MLGHGTFGIVEKAEWNVPGDKAYIVAVKTTNAQKDFKNEVCRIDKLFEGKDHLKFLYSFYKNWKLNFEIKTCQRINFHKFHCEFFLQQVCLEIQISEKTKFLILTFNSHTWHFWKTFFILKRFSFELYWAFTGKPNGTIHVVFPVVVGFNF